MNTRQAYLLEAKPLIISEFMLDVIEFEYVWTQPQTHKANRYNVIKVWGKVKDELYYLGECDVIDFKVSPSAPIKSGAQYLFTFLSVDILGNISSYFHARFFVHTSELPFTKGCSAIIVVANQ